MTCRNPSLSSRTGNGCRLQPPRGQKKPRGGRLCRVRLGSEADASALLRMEGWRRGWDSNPRYACTYNGFRDRPDRPLWHLSAKGTADQSGADHTRGAASCNRSPDRRIGELFTTIRPDIRPFSRRCWIFNGRHDKAGHQFARRGVGFREEDGTGLLTDGP